MNTKMIEINSSVITSNVSGFHLYKVPRIVKIMKIEIRIMVTRGWGGETEKNRRYCLTAIELCPLRWVRQKEIWRWMEVVLNTAECTS